MAGRVYNDLFALEVPFHLSRPVLVMRRLEIPVITADLQINNNMTMVNRGRTIRSVMLQIPEKCTLKKDSKVNVGQIQSAVPVQPRSGVRQEKHGSPLRVPSSFGQHHITG